MNQNAEHMLETLSPEIDRKCRELQNARKARRLFGLFILLCAAAAIVPALGVLAGVPPALFLTPIVFMSLSVLLLLPVLISGKASHSGKGDLTHEQA